MSNVNALPIESPNLFSLSGGGLTVSLALSGIDGKPHFSYQDAHQSQSFSGDEITLEETTLDTLASVTLVRTVDFGDTTFTLLVPRSTSSARPVTSSIRWVSPPCTGRQ